MGRKVSCDGAKTSTNVKPVEPCFVCEETVGNNDVSALQCELCSKWSHGGCLGIPSEVVAFFRSPSYEKATYALPLLCPACKPTLTSLADINNKLSTIEMRFEARLAALEHRPNLPSSATAFKIVPQTTPGPTNGLAALVKDAIEIESKKSNAVLFGLENSEDDLDAVRNLLQEVDGTGLKPEDIIRVFRDGPKLTGKPQFLKVLCNNSQSKKLFINLINNSRRKMLPTFKNLRARPDLSYLQRKRSRELQSELKTRIDSGETDLYVDYISDCVKHYQPRQNFKTPNVSG